MCLCEDKTVPCEICGKPTTMTGTKRCDRCWELEGRIRRDLHLAERIIKTIKEEKAACKRINVILGAQISTDGGYDDGYVTVCFTTNYIDTILNRMNAAAKAKRFVPLDGCMSIFFNDRTPYAYEWGDTIGDILGNDIDDICEISPLIVEAFPEGERISLGYTEMCVGPEGVSWRGQYKHTCNEVVSNIVSRENLMAWLLLLETTEKGVALCPKQ